MASSEPIRFAVGPFLPTTDDTRKEWEPMFDGFARTLGRPYKLAVTSDWAGISIALASGQADYGFVGPFGYILAKKRAKMLPLAVSMVNGSPTYKGVVVARKGLDIKRFPEDAKGLRISFADQGSTTGWLVPSFWFKQQGIDPKTYFKYRDGATHAANEVAVASGQVDLATDNDRNRRIMIEKGVIKAEDSVIVWESDPVPNSLMAGRAAADPGLTAELKGALLAITPEMAAKTMPKNFTGWAETKDSDYDVIEQAAVSLGQIKAS
ncbi:phosphate/phosphite/phosphonate ABC transporter substrate-binding protein [Rhizobium sp.]|uniref:phosphate/phosphite/phosphonate ABC transporter substrate-binding protein n=1 Tax=Rhizobium sp. TaxID=391 RepID=UPI003917DD71